MEFSRQKYQSGLLFPTRENLPKPGIELMSLSSPVMAGRFFTRSPINGKLMYGCESWTVKKAERRRIDAFELWCWRRLLRVPLKIQPVHSKGDQSQCSLEGMMLKLKLQYFGHLTRRVDSLEKILMLGGLGAGGEGDDRG